jgi:hypothetical protein
MSLSLWEWWKPRGRRKRRSPSYYDYIDTSFEDSHRHTWTVGVATSDWLRAGVMYQTHINTTPGSAPTDDGGVEAQVMRRNPWWCYSKWCMNPDRTEPFIVPWLYSVPHLNYLGVEH